ncbi:MAG: FHA domain-containing protein, partial [Pyrinomonadaceae bacterium]|nr:FHA domain-containing protein [Pyrinomonadaceae bacterium]
MPDLIVKYPDRAPGTSPLGRLRITIGRSARNDICISDPFASRVHAEVRCEGDLYVMQDLGSANGTYYNGERAEAPIHLTHGGRIQIGETEIEFRDTSVADELTAASIDDHLPAAFPGATIAFEAANHRTTSG